MTEEFCTLKDGRQICFRSFGEGDPLVLIAGLGLHLTYWPEDLIQGFVARGRKVVTFDNRDVGRSSLLNAPAPTLRNLIFRRPPDGSYSLSDMASDVVELLDHLKIERTDLVGISMGGMIGQVMAAERPERVRSLTSIYSSTGARGVGRTSFGMQLRFLKKPPKTAEEMGELFADTMTYVGGPAFPPDLPRLKAYGQGAFRRNGLGAAAGVGRQIMAIFQSGDRTKSLSRISAPTLVLHGDRDRLVNPSGGRATARAIPGAKLQIIKGMGHDIGIGLAPKWVELISDHMRGA